MGMELGPTLGSPVMPGLSIPLPAQPGGGAAGAVKAGVSGQAVIQCGVLADGHLDRCAVVAEQPQGLGFGEASLEMGTLFKMRPTTADGQPVDGAQVMIPFNWSLGH